ncbi:Predicted transcriptional regulator, ArsR family [Actinomadura meyerae]|uniref:Predicted transcriptional regulator, ArsR family n=1 Tax=Actinomadura meyerae TaxID=240840 RepID=A0A239J9Y0_9ACTN|nr:helix-turn-helix domain-containing protein [Actinomadura meyerae]SNT02298.1 Predicted transcriptional regulator, ArsR family [Actinomadura meyerae]
MTSDSAGLEAAAILSDDLRRRMYAFIRAAKAPVTRDEAAASVGISRKLAAFHLDKLVDAGLLSARYADPSGVRRVGRAPKVYEPSGVDVRVSIPQREHGLLAGILLDAVRGQEPGESGRDAALRAAGERGRALGEAERRPVRGGRLGAERALTRAAEVLEGHGFEPEREGPERLRLRNCPFHPMAADDPDLVCGVNHAFLSGVVDGLGASGVEARLAPEEGYCCVEFGPRNG